MTSLHVNAMMDDRGSNSSQSNSRVLLFSPPPHGANNYLLIPTSNYAGSSVCSSDRHTKTDISGSEINTVTQLKNSLVEFALFMQENEVREGIYGYVLTLVLHIYMFWIGVFLPNVGWEMMYGEWGTWVFSILNYPMTLSFERIPYGGAIVLAFFGVFTVVLYMALVIWTIFAYKTTSQYLKYSKRAVAIFSKVLPFISVPALYLMTFSLDCNYSGGTYNLNRFEFYSHESILCHDTTNIVFVVIMILSIISLIILNIFSMIVIPNCHPLNVTPFITENSIFMTLLVVFNELQLFLHFVIPTQYSFIRGIVHVVGSLALIVIFAKLIPFLRRIENSIVFGVLLARLFSSIGALVTSIVNNPSLSKITLTIDNTLGVGLAGLTIGLIIVGFIVGLVLMELYTRFVVKGVRHFVLECIQSDDEKDIDSKDIEKSIEKEGQMIYQQLLESKKVGHLRLFFKFAMKFKESTPTSSETTSNEVTNINICIALIRGFSSNNQLDTEIILLSSMIVANFLPNEVNSTTFAQGLLKKALKRRPPLYYKLLISLAQKQVEATIYQSNPESRNNVEMSKLIDHLEKRQEELRALHRAFWKEIMQENINHEKCESIIVRIGILSNECETKFKNLMHIYKNDKTVLRCFAKYVESFKFNKEAAQELYSEATTIEEEDSKRTHASSKRRMKKNQKNRVHPQQLSQAFETLSYGGDMNHETESNIAGEMNQNDFGGVENNPELKKELLFRNALAISHKNQTHFALFFIFMVLSFIVLVSSLVMSLLFSNYVTESVIVVDTACAPISSTIRIVSGIRSYQSSLFIYKDNITAWPSSLMEYGYSSISEFKRIHKKELRNNIDSFILLKDLAQTAKFTMDMYSEFHESYYPFNQPKSFTEGLEKEYNSTTINNITIADMTNLAITYAEQIYKYEDEDYLHTISSYPFMLLFNNRNMMTAAYSSFCYKFVEKSKSYTKMISNTFAIYYACSIVVYFTYTAIYLCFARLDLAFLKKLVVLLEKNVSKNEAGRMYHDLGKIVQDDSAVRPSKNSALYPRNVVVALGIVTATFIAICSGLFLAQTLNNSQYSFESYVTMRDAFNALENSQYLVDGITEELIHSKITSHSFINGLVAQTELSEIIHQSIKKIRFYWNMCMYGSNYYPDETLVIGMFEKTDLMIKGDANCTLQMMISNNCSVGVDNLVTSYISRAAQFTEDIDLKSTTFESLFDDFLIICFFSSAVSKSLLDFSDVFAISASVPSDKMVIPFAILGFILLFSLSLAIYISMTKSFHSVQQLRLLFNYLPLDLMDSNENIKNYIVHHHLPDSFSSVLRRKKGSSSEGDSKVRNILNASVDGAVMCSGEKVDIEIFNPAAQKIFGYNQTETIGRSLYQLFEKSEQSKIKKLVDEMMVNAARGDSKGDSIELNCIRKNESTFPARINIFVTSHNSQNVVTCFIKDITTEKKHNLLLAEEKKHSEELLLNILPNAVASKLKSGETYIAEKFNDVSCFFSDMVGFTKLSTGIQASELVQMLNEIVIGFDDLTDKYNLEKIKTIGDSYFCVGGLHGLNAQSDHPERMLRFSIDTFDVLQRFNAKSGKHPSEQINIRVGINTGSVIAGVIGRKKFAYDLWGDTINTASRMESNSIPGRIQISRSTYERVYDLGFTFEERHLDVKGKGECVAYMLDEKHHSPALVPSFTDMLRSSLNILQKRASNLEYHEEIKTDQTSLIEFATISNITQTVNKEMNDSQTDNLGGVE